MDELKVLLENLGINIALILAGIFGSIVSMGNKKGLSLWERVVAWLSGGAIANYITPIIISTLNISESTKYGFAFLLGFSGLEGVKWLIITFKNKYNNKNEEQ
jgi:hypothetical protein